MSITQELRAKGARVPMALASVFTACSMACASAAATGGSLSAPRITDTDMVTVIPFQFSPIAAGLILLPAEVDGRRGTFLLDMGSPLIALDSKFLQAVDSGGLDTNTTGFSREGQNRQFPVNVHTLRVGTFVYHFDSTHVESPVQWIGTNAILYHDPRFDWLVDTLKRPTLGLLGLPAWAPFETIIDYVHKRVILIRVDSVGHRLAAVPQFTPAWTMALLPVANQSQGPKPEIYGVEAITHGAHIQMELDTGSPTNNLSSQTDSLRLPLVPVDSGNNGQRLDHLLIGGHDYTDLIFDSEQGFNVNMLGYPFLSRYGIVGFNLRAHQLIVYQTGGKL